MFCAGQALDEHAQRKCERVGGPNGELVCNRVGQSFFEVQRAQLLLLGNSRKDIIDARIALRATKGVDNLLPDGHEGLYAQVPCLTPPELT